MSEQPPYPPQPPYQPPHQPQQPPLGGEPTIAPGAGWGQPPQASQAPQAPQQPVWQPGYSPAPGTPPGPGPKKPWGLVVAALVAGLVVGGGAATGIVLASSGDPKDSDEYIALDKNLDEARASLDAGAGGTEPDGEATADSPSVPEATVSSEAPTDPDPGSAGSTIDVDGWAVSEPDVHADVVDDFEATFTATNNTGEPATAYFDLVLSLQGATVAELTCSDDAALESDDLGQTDPGQTASLTCYGLTDYVEGGWDAVDVTYGF